MVDIVADVVVVAVLVRFLKTCHSEFVGNNANSAVTVWGGMTASIYHSKFISNTGSKLLYLHPNLETNMISVTHSEFVNNTASHYVVALYGDNITLSLSIFINNRAMVVMWIIKAGILANNMFIGNSAEFEMYIRPVCNLGLMLACLWEAVVVFNAVKIGVEI